MRIGQYYLNRIARIYPVYLVALLLMCLVLFLKGEGSIQKNLPLHVLSLQAWLPGEAQNVNSPGWTISVEMFFYALFPGLVNRIYNRFSFVYALGGVLAIWLVTQAFSILFLHSVAYAGPLTLSHNFLYFFPLLHLNEFLIGNVAGLLFLACYKRMTRNFDVLIGLLVFVLAGCLYYNPGYFLHNGLLSFLFAPLIVLLALNTGRVSALFRHRFFVLLGEVSFSMYILQLPVFKLSGAFFRSMVGVQDPARIFYFSFLILMLVSTCMYFFVETPLRTRIRGLADGKWAGTVRLSKFSRQPVRRDP